MRRSLFFVLMLVLVLRGLMGTAMAAGVLAPMMPLSPPTSEAHAHAPAHLHAHEEDDAQTAQDAQLTQLTPQAQSHNHGDQGDQDDRSDQGSVADHLHHPHHTSHTAHADQPADAAPAVPLASNAPCTGTHAGTSADCGAHDHAGTCSACEICHSAMLGAPALLPLAHRLPGSVQSQAVAAFDSAPAALAIKPPIA
jgi:hypothetical protein